LPTFRSSTPQKRKQQNQDNTHNNYTSLDKMSKWDAQKERDLATAIFTATAPHPAEVKQKIIEMMAEAGHIVNWDATRYVKLH
jgi:hypothetical protein